MTSHVEFAQYDPHYHQVRVTYTKRYKGLVQNRHTDFLETEPKGDWVMLNFGPDDNVSYPEFLNTMVHRNIEVTRKMNLIELDRILEQYPYDTHVHCELLNSISILDDTFDPPIINLSCRWQREMVQDIVTIHFRIVISTCRNITNMLYLFKILRTI